MENDSDNCSCSDKPAQETNNLAAARQKPASYWQNHNTLALRYAFSQKAPPFKTDVVIVGGGLAGLSTAIRLLERAPETKVTVLEQNFVGYGASGRNGGLMSPIPAPIWLASAKNSADHAWAMQALHRKVQEIGTWLENTLPQCEIKTTPLRIAATGKLTRAGLYEVADVLHHCGIESQITSPTNTNSAPAVELAAFTVHPYRLVQALAQHAAHLGADIIEDCAVKEILSPPDDNAPPTVCLTDGTKISTKRVVLCTNAYTGQSGLARKVSAKPMHNFMLATKPMTDQQIKSLTNNRAFTVELNKAYVFYRQYGDRIIFGGIEKLSQHATQDFEVPHKVLTNLKTLFKKSLPALSDLEIDESWGGKYHQTLTDLPIIQADNDRHNVILNIGYGGTGVALTQCCASMAASLVLGEAHEKDIDARLHQTIATTKFPVLGSMKFAGRVARRLFSGQ